MAITVALAGDTMLGRGVADAMAEHPERALFSAEVMEATRAADLFVLNLECCISARGTPWPAPGKPFFFRALPKATDVLVELGVDCVTLANNHALDCGTDALLETFDHLRAAGITWAGAGEDVEQARTPTIVGGLPVLAFADQQASFAATADRPGIAYVDLSADLPGWLRERATNALVCPHWGPNMTPSPLPYVRSAARALREAGATLVAGTSAHVFHGVEENVLYDLGDFLDDYVVDPQLRNDLGLLFLVELEGSRVQRIEAVPLKLDYTYTRLAHGSEAEWIRQRFRRACAELGTEVLEEDGRLIVNGEA